MICALSFYMMCFRSIVQLHTHRKRSLREITWDMWCNVCHRIFYWKNIDSRMNNLKIAWFYIKNARNWNFGWCNRHNRYNHPLLKNRKPLLSEVHVWIQVRRPFYNAIKQMLNFSKLIISKILQFLCCFPEKWLRIVPLIAYFYTKPEVSPWKLLEKR